uniref:Pre-C2HC domain-containing protein n=1 Tax=Anopheles albimanus TaxID=7167 RepID=A0A182FWK7_ANOAL
MKEEEILEGLHAQGATEVQIIKRKEKEDKLVNTKMAIVTLKKPKIPRKVDFGLYMLKVELYVPRPMRCTMCMRLGHTKKWCKGEQVCAKCSKPMHLNQCNETKCISCGENHHTLDKNCPVYLDEYEIQRIRTEKRIAYGEARRIRRGLSGPTGRNQDNIRKNDTNNNQDNNHRKHNTNYNKHRKHDT